MADWMRSAGMLTSRAFWTARRSLKLPSRSPPPSLAAMVISRLARVKAWPRFASTAAFLCLMPAHLECPDIYSLFFCSNMLSLNSSLADPYPDELPASDLKHVAVLEDAIRIDRASVDPHPILLEEAQRLSPARGQACLDQGAWNVVWIRCAVLGDLL